MMHFNPAGEGPAGTTGQMPSAPANKHPAPIPRRIYLLVCIVGLAVTSLVGYGFYTGHRISITYAPLIDATMEIKLEATAAHLGFKEFLHTGTGQNYSDVWLHVEEAMWYLRAMLKGGKNFEGTFMPVPDEELLQQVKAAQHQFKRLKSMMLQRLKTAVPPETNNETDQERDARFNAFIKEIDHTETRLQQLMSQSLNRFRLAQAILIAACILLAAVTAIYFRRFEQQRLENYHRVQRSNARLENEIVKRRKAEANVRKAYDGLESKVKERTRELDTANKQLTREIRERRKAEKGLLDYHARLRALSSELSLSEERERRRIAETLHDGIGQNLSAIAMGKLSKLRHSGSGELDAGVDDIGGLIKETIEQTRRVIFELAPSTLYELGLVAAVEELIDKTKAEHNLKIAFRGGASVQIEDEGMRGFLFQSVRELLSNVTQHSRARAAGVSIRKQGQQIRIDVTDDGIGFDAAKCHLDSNGNPGLGIFKIQERLRYFGGALDIQSRAGKGTHAVLLMPLK